MNQPENNQDFLQAARANKLRGNEFEQHSALRGMNLSQIIALTVGGIIFFVQLLVKYVFDFGLLAVLMSLICVEYLYEGIKLRQVWKIILGSVFGVFTLFLLVCWIGTVAA